MLGNGIVRFFRNLHLGLFTWNCVYLFFSPLFLILLYESCSSALYGITFYFWLCLEAKVKSKVINFLGIILML